MSLLYILKLFAHLFYIGLKLYSNVTRDKIVGLREDRVGFPVHLLGDKIKLTSYRAALGQYILRGPYVTAKPYYLLIDAYLVRVERNLSEYP